MQFNRMVVLVGLLLVCPVLASGDEGSSSREVVGKTYEIVEEDHYQMMMREVESKDWESLMTPERAEKMVKEFKPKNLVPLPRAEKDRVFYPDMTYELQFDIPDGKGGVLYPKGFKWNPGDFVIMTVKMVVIDGSDEAQVKWFEGSDLVDKLDVMLLVTDGSWFDLSQRFGGRQVYYAMSDMVVRWKLEAVPSVIRQVEKRIEIREVKIGQEVK